MAFPLLLLTLVILGGSIPLEAAGTRVEGQLIVQLRKPLQARSIAGELQQPAWPEAGLVHLRVLSERHAIHLLAFDPTRSSAEPLLARLRQHPMVKAAQFNYRVAPRLLPNDPELTRQWGLQAIQAPESWDITTGGQTSRGDDIVVAILDSGYEVDHEDLRENIWINRGEIPNDGIDNDENGYVDDISGWNFADDSPVHGIDYHGTSVSGIIGAQGDNQIGVAGINWSVQLMLFDIQFVDQIISSYDYVIEQRSLYNRTNGTEGAFVVVTNASIGLDEVFCDEQPVWGSMYDLLGQVGVLTAAGPSNRNVDVDEVGDMPTTCTSDYLIATLNTNAQDEKHPNSAWGTTSIDLGSPGQGSYTTGLDNGYRNFNGNSAAVPHLTGTIALLYSLPCTFIAESAINQPAQTALLMRQVVLEGTDRLPALSSYTLTGGRLNILQSIGIIEELCEGQTGPMNILNLYPNPADTRLRVDYETPDFEPYTFEVFNTLGQLVYTQEVTPSQFSEKSLFIPLAGWAPGMYVLRMRREERRETRKFLVLPR